MIKLENNFKSCKSNFHLLFSDQTEQLCCLDYTPGKSQERVYAAKELVLKTYYRLKCHIAEQRSSSLFSIHPYRQNAPASVCPSLPVISSSACLCFDGQAT